MCWSQSWMCFIRVILVILAHFVSPQEFSKKHGDTEYSALLCFVCWNARQSSLSVSVTNSSQDLEDINTVLIWRKKNTRPCFPPVENNRKCLILLLGNSRKMMWWMCMTLYRASNLMIFFFFSFFFSPFSHFYSMVIFQGLPSLPLSLALLFVLSSTVHPTLLFQRSLPQ